MVTNTYKYKRIYMHIWMLQKDFFLKAHNQNNKWENVQLCSYCVPGVTLEQTRS